MKQVQEILDTNVDHSAYDTPWLGDMHKYLMKNYPRSFSTARDNAEQLDLEMFPVRQALRDELKEYTQ